MPLQAIVRISFPQGIYKSLLFSSTPLNILEDSKEYVLLCTYTRTSISE